MYTLNEKNYNLFCRIVRFRDSETKKIFLESVRRGHYFEVRITTIREDQQNLVVYDSYGHLVIQVLLQRNALLSFGQRMDTEVIIESCIKKMAFSAPVKQESIDCRFGSPTWKPPGYSESSVAKARELANSDPVKSWQGHRRRSIGIPGKRMKAGA